MIRVYDAAGNVIETHNRKGESKNMKAKLTIYSLGIVLSLINETWAQSPLPSVAGNTGPVTLFSNVRIFDGKSNKLSAPSYVLVRGNVIEKISTTPLPTDRRADTVLIDGGGRTLMPRAGIDCYDADAATSSAT